MTTATMARPQRREIKRVLVANRGEIASRVFRTCRTLGKATVAVYSAADRELPYVRDADTAVYLGGATATESYLSIPKLIDACRCAGADAVHPGYGFLAENADFARAVADAGLAWIGPTPESIVAIGDKRHAKELLAERAPRIPLVPGYHGAAGQDTPTLVARAKEVGFPLLLKAAAGGGGKGMRVVRDPSTLERDIESARGEGLRSFANAELLIERFVERAKHVEVQILGDMWGHVVSVGTRECSYQRRHQKVVEEAPAPRSYPGLEECAVEIGRLIHYVGAGTVEFLVDAHTNEFYFLEVNTRLQVEHPVTEQVWPGLDLVAMQIRIAEGCALKDLLPPKPPVGGLHAIECRLYAEDPASNFAPSTGRILGWKRCSHPNVRYESTVAAGSTVSVFYDAMICKIIATGRTRDEAIVTMRHALLHTVVLGAIRTNRAFLVDLMDHADFRSAQYVTRTISDFLATTPQVQPNPGPELLMAATALALDRLRAKRTLWRGVPSGWRNMPLTVSTMRWHFEDTEASVAYLHTTSPSEWFMSVGTDSKDTKHNDVTVKLVSVTSDVAIVEINGVAKPIHFVVGDPMTNDDAAEHVLYLQPTASPASFTLHKLPKLRSADPAAAGSKDATYRATMPCRVLQVAVKHGQRVRKGDLLLVFESMKMETRVLAQQDGVAQIMIRADQLVEAGKVMAQVVAPSTEAEASGAA